MGYVQSDLRRLKAHDRYYQQWLQANAQWWQYAIKLVTMGIQGEQGAVFAILSVYKFHGKKLVSYDK